MWGIYCPACPPTRIKLPSLSPDSKPNPPITEPPYPQLKSHPRSTCFVSAETRGLNNIPQTICQRTVSVRPPGLLIRTDKKNIRTDSGFPSSLYIPSSSQLFTSLHFHSFQSVFHFLFLLSALLAVRGGSGLILEEKVKEREEEEEEGEEEGWN